MTPLLKKEMSFLNVPQKKHFSREYFEETTLTTQREREREREREHADDDDARVETTTTTS